MLFPQPMALSAKIEAQRRKEEAPGGRVYKEDRNIIIKGLVVTLHSGRCQQVLINDLPEKESLSSLPGSQSIPGTSYQKKKGGTGQHVEFLQEDQVPFNAKEHEDGERWKQDAHGPFG